MGSGMIKSSLSEDGESLMNTPFSLAEEGSHY